MSAFDQQFTAVAPALYNSFAEDDPVTYTPVGGVGVDIRATVTETTEMFSLGEPGKERERKADIMFSQADVPVEPKRGCTVLVQASSKHAGKFVMQNLKSRAGGQWTIECHIVSVPGIGAKNAQQVR